ncbi:MAG TPA: response regulator [Opitutus sp.]|nr:response regulator [Opitutus sp.]
MLTDPPSPAPPAVAPVSILLVDDEPRNLDVLESLLHTPEYRLVRAVTAEQALMLLLNGEFAAIVLDIQMPGMNGIELANLIKQRRRTQHIPIIFLTAYFQEDKDILQGYGSGAVDYLTKPINPQILRSKIAVFVDLFRKTRALAASNAALELEITQRQKAEEALRQANTGLESRVASRTADLQRANVQLLAREAQIRLVTNSAPVFIAQIDREHRFKFVNRTYARCFGLEPEQVIGRHFIEIMGEEPYGTIRQHLDAALEGRRVEFEAEIAYAGLGPRWVFVIHEPERSATGEVIGLVAVVTDITERRQAEQAVAAARDQALAASRTKDEFLARLSHELRTPLNPVLLLASDAANNPLLPAHVRADFETIVQNVSLEARLIDDLLDLTAITRGKLALERRPVAIHPVLRDVVAMLRQEIARKQISLVLQFEATRDAVDGDDVRLKQIFWNVLKNAVKFTPEEGRVTIGTAADKDGRKLVVTVADTGIGMTPEEHARIFHAFSQGDHAAQGSGRFGGLGLGLVISRMLVELHSGIIEATSAGRNQGSVFTIALPLSREKARGDAPARKVAGGAAGTGRNGVDGRPLRVLLIEDHEPTCTALADLLGRRHFEVLKAMSARQARAVAEREKFDFVISDVGLPDGNGCDLMGELRDRHGLAGIALTGYGMNDDLERSRAAGFVTHLTKPVSVQKLDEALALLTGAA